MFRYFSPEEYGSAFQIFVDRIEEKFAVCEFPDDSMKDVPKEFFLDGLCEHSKYYVRYDNKGNLEYLFKVFYINGNCEKSFNPIKKLQARFIRF